MSLFSPGLGDTENRMYLARQADYEPSSASANGQRGGSPWGLRRWAPGKCWARELAVIESWHSLLAERDVTVGNCQGGKTPMTSLTVTGFEGKVSYVVPQIWTGHTHIMVDYNTVCAQPSATRVHRSVSAAEGLACMLFFLSVSFP